MTNRLFTNLVVLMILFWVTTCGQETYVLITLLPDSQLNTYAEVASQVSRFQVYLDATDGFSNLPNSDTEQAFETIDADSDSQLELLYELPSTAGSHLPRIRIDPGNQATRRIAIQVLGLDEQSQVSAAGQTPAHLLFQSSGQSELTIPFNLTPSHRAPVVVALTPYDVPQNRRLSSIGIFFSKPMDAASLSAGFSLTQQKPQTTIEIEGVLDGPFSCQGQLEMWRFKPAGCHTIDISDKLEIGIRDSVADQNGQPLLNSSQQPGFQHTLTSQTIWFLGPCTQGLGCNPTGTAGFRWDLQCDLASGSYAPARCSIAPDGCLNAQFGFDWTKADSRSQCQGYRSDTQLLQDGSCGISNDAWSCDKQIDCADFGSDKCDMQGNACIPKTCNTTCQDERLGCLTSMGCLPRLGTCSPDCLVFGGCPTLGHSCIQNERQVGICQIPQEG